MAATHLTGAALLVLALGACTEPLLELDLPDRALAERPRGYPLGVQAPLAQPEFERVLCPGVATAEEALAASEKRFEAGELAASYACADLASELAPRAVEAHHLRAATLAALGRLGDAKIGFSMALALDPDDPETLAAVADFYINVLPARSRAQIALGLEYARRGSERAATRRRADRQLRARLLLLEAEAMNDLGSSDLALPRIDEALALVPDWLEARHERGVSLFNLVRFDEARAAFEAVLARVPDDAYAHYHLGLLAEHLGDHEVARRHLDRARSLAPADLAPAVVIDAAGFRAEVNEAIAELDAADRALLESVELELVDLPARDDLVAVTPPFAPTIMGLYRGLPVGVEISGGRTDPDGGRPVDSLAVVGGTTPPRAIVLFRLNLSRHARTRAELDAQIRKTLRHEIGHARGLGEPELRRLGLD